MMPEESRGTVGQLNGKWALLLKSMLALGAVLLPFGVGWCTWATVQLFSLQNKFGAFEAVGPRYTATQAQVDQLTMRATILQDVAKNYPPQWLRDEVASMSRRLGTIEEDVAEMRKWQLQDRGK